MKKHDAIPAQSTIIRNLLVRIDAFMSLTGVSETRLGREVMGDTSLVHRIRKGGDIYTGTVDSLDVWMNAYLQAHPPGAKDDFPDTPRRNSRGRRVPLQRAGRSVAA